MECRVLTHARYCASMDNIQAVLRRSEEFAGKMGNGAGLTVCSFRMSSSNSTRPGSAAVTRSCFRDG